MAFKSVAKFVLMALVGMAIGVLCGDSIMDLLPEAFGVHSPDGMESRRKGMHAGDRNKLLTLLVICDKNYGDTDSKPNMTRKLRATSTILPHSRACAAIS